MKKRGVFLVIEGTDGSGKTEQFKRLIARLRKERVPLATFDFPRYKEPSSYFVRQYLEGVYGSWEAVGPYKASLFYALDRFEAAGQVRKALGKGKVILADRYVASNMGHQGAKIGDRKGRTKFFKWLHELEYSLLKIPEPTLTVVLHVPAKVALSLIRKRGERRDIHEVDLSHLRRAESTYIEMAERFPHAFKLIECVENGRLLTVGEIHEKVWAVVRQTLKRRK
jgi:dTMP kinase